MAAEERIYDTTWECIDLFENCRDTSLAWDHRDQDWLEEREADFKSWAHGIRANKTGHSSLDYRLRDRLDIRDTFLGLINGISKSLDMCIRNGGKAMIEENYHEQEIGLDRHDPAPSPWIEYNTNAGNSQSLGSLPQVPSSSTSRCLYYIQTNINIIMTITLAIRRSGTKVKHERADLALATAPVSYDELRLHLSELILVRPYDILMNTLDIAVMNKRVAPTIAILIRKWLHEPSRLYEQLANLIQAVVVRHNRINSARDPRILTRPKRKRAHPQPATPRLQTTQADTSLGTRVSTAASDLPSGHPIHVYSSVGNNIAPRPGNILDKSNPWPMAVPSLAPSTKSLTASRVGSSFVLPNISRSQQPLEIITEVTRTGYDVDYPPRPVTKKGARNFMCPYCCLNLPSEYLNTKTRWRGHVAHDILPYTCVFEGCTTPTSFYNTREEWIFHMKEKHSFIGWVCEECPVRPEDTTLPTFDSVDFWQSHMRTDHNRVLVDAQLFAEAKLSERRILQLMRCPLCPRSQQLYSLEAEDHIALHLHSFALEALPRDIGRGIDPLDDHDSGPPNEFQSNPDIKWRLDRYMDQLQAPEVEIVPGDDSPTQKGARELNTVMNLIWPNKIAVILDPGEIPAGCSGIVYEYLKPLLQEEALFPCFFPKQRDIGGIERITHSKAHEILHKNDSENKNSQSSRPLSSLPNMLQDVLTELGNSDWFSITEGEERVLIIVTFGQWLSPRAVDEVSSILSYGMPRGRAAPQLALSNIKAHVVFFGDNDLAARFQVIIDSQSKRRRGLNTSPRRQRNRSLGGILTTEQYESGGITHTLMNWLRHSSQAVRLSDNKSPETNALEKGDVSENSVQHSNRNSEAGKKGIGITPNVKLDAGKTSSGQRQSNKTVIEAKTETRKPRFNPVHISSYRLRKDDLEEYLNSVFNTDSWIEAIEEEGTYIVFLPTPLTQWQYDEIDKRRMRRRFKG